MKKKIVIVFIVLAVLKTFLWMFDILRFYNYPTLANEPNLKQGAKFVWSSFVKPERLDFICFEVKSDTSNYEVAMRLVGLPNDVLEIKKGTLFVNNINIDKGLDLRRLYKFERNYFDSQISPHIESNQFYYSIYSDSISAFIDDNKVEELNLKLNPEVMSVDAIDELVSLEYGKKWNSDNFGPIHIPENKYFAIGDNRSNSYDSRYLGLISEENILGTIIYIYQ